jgi:hypothetical protein
MSSEVHDETNGPAATEIESVWLTRGSVKPIWLAVSLLATLIGLFAFLPLLVAGAVVSLLIAGRWVSEARAESGELPLS